MTAALYWLVAMVILTVIECISLGLTTIWFAGGALVAAIAAALGAPVYVQVVLCILVSGILLIFTRPWAMRFLNNRTVKTNAESLVGEIAIVTMEVNNLKSEGQIQIKGSYWTARSTDDSVTIAKDKKVRIEEISGVKCLVVPVAE